MTTLQLIPSGKKTVRRKEYGIKKSKSISANLDLIPTNKFRINAQDFDNALITSALCKKNK